jgi:uncharacterized protein DUF1214
MQFPEYLFEAQKTVGISGMGNKVWKAKPYDKVQYQKLHDKYMQETIDTGLFLEYGYDASRIDMKIKRISDAVGWGGMDFGIHSYQISRNMSSEHFYSTTFPAVQVNDDGSITVYYGPSKPEGVFEGNWVQTNANEGWFQLLRIYSPGKAFFDKTWKPGKLEIVN